MKKRKKASSSASRSARSGHPLGPTRAAGAARATKSHGTKVSDPSKRKAAPPPIAEKPSTTLALAAECIVSGASSLKEQLAGLLDEPLPVTLDITALQRIDTAGLQVITAFVRERASRGRLVEWQGSAPVLVTAAQLLGLTTLLKLPA
jgi:ABC-type transporter Mla MlaB component